MAFFPAEFSNKAGKYIKKLDEITRGRIHERINKLEGDPFPQEVERVEDYNIGARMYR